MKFFETVHPDAVYPVRATKGSAGYDVVAVDNGAYDDSRGVFIFDTGIKLGELPLGTFVALYPRSSIFKTHLRLANSVGIIDRDYPDTIKVIFDVSKPGMMSLSDIRKYVKGDRIAQLVVSRYVNDGEVVVQTRTGGLGSTNKKTSKSKKKETK